MVQENYRINQHTHVFTLLVCVYACYRIAGNFGGRKFWRIYLIHQNFLHQIFIFMGSAVVKNRLCRIRQDFPHQTRD